MAIIVNLSSLINYSISGTLRAFANLCKLSRESSRCSCCPSFFATLVDLPWVYHKYHQSRCSIIEPYRRGEIGTKELLQKLADVFSFLRTIKYPEELVAELSQNRGQYISLHYVPSNSDLNQEDIACALLEKAWTASITFNDVSRERLQRLVDSGEEIYFISNTNEMDVNRILQLLWQNSPEMQWLPNIDFSCPINKEQTPVTIAPKIHLCLSYRYKLYKTLADGAEIKCNTTDTLLNQLVATVRQHDSSYSPTVISQYGKDLEMARALGLERCFSPEQYYTQPSEKQHLLP